MKNKNIILGYKILIKPQGERFYTESPGFYETKEEAKAEANKITLFGGDKLTIKTIFAI